MRGKGRGGDEGRGGEGQKRREEARSNERGGREIA